MIAAWRARIEAMVSEKWFIHGITLLILINAVTLGLETSETVMAKYGGQLRMLDHVILCCFVLEILLKLFACGFRFFKSGWNVFDLLIVGISLAPAAGPFSILRTLRILRVLRLISVVPRLRRVISALLTAIPGMASVMMILMIIFYITAVMATQTFGTNPDADMQKYFGDIGNSMFTLFQIMTLEGWNDIAAATLALYPMAWIFFVIFITIASFAVLNLFIGIIVDAMNLMHDEEGDSRAHKDHSEEMALLRKVHREIGKLRADVDELKSGGGKKK